MTDPVLDPHVIDGLRQLNQPGEPDVVREVLMLFIHDAPQRIEAVTNAARSGQAESLQRAAHALKGAAATIGATGLQRICRELEDLGKRESTNGVGAALQALYVEYERVREAIEQLL